MQTLTHSDKPTHLIFQTAHFNFFQAIRWKSVAMLELLTDKCQFLYVDYHTQRKMSADTIANLHAHPIKFAQIMSDETVTYAQAIDIVHKQLDAFKIDTVSFFNGNTVSKYDMEQCKWYKMFNECKAHPNEPLVDFLKSEDIALQWVCTFIVAEYAAAKHIQCYNFCEDPLQHKLDYIDGLQIRHFYFHFVPDNIYVQQCKDGSEHHSKFEFSPSQQYWYCMCQHRGMSAKCDKQRDFVFAMTDSWPDRRDRYNYILRMDHLCELDSSKFLFKYTTRRHNNQWKHNGPLIPYEEYLQLIKTAKFTLSIPSYDENCFSLRRFFEALTNDCIPLVLDTCNYKYGFNCNQEFIDIVEKWLLVNVEDLSVLDEVVAEAVKHYDEILAAIKSTTYWKAYHNPRLYTRQLAELYIKS